MPSSPDAVIAGCARLFARADSALNHAVRKKVAAAHGDAAIAAGITDPWSAMFAAAVAGRSAELRI